MFIQFSPQLEQGRHSGKAGISVFIVFGFIGMRAAVNELWKFVRKPKEKMFWWYTHLGNLIGSYIAAWTAFLVVTVSPRLNALGVYLWLASGGTTILTTSHRAPFIAPLR